ILRSHRAMCEAAGLKLAGLTPRGVASGATLNQALATGAASPPEPADGTVAVLARGERWGELIIGRGGLPLLARPLPATALNNETALVGELRRNLALFAGQNPQQPVRALYVAEADQPGGWAGRLGALPVPVQRFDPLAALGRPPAGDYAGRGEYVG